MRSKTVVRSKNWKHVTDPSTSKAPGKALVKGGSEVKRMHKTNMRAKLPKNSKNFVVEDTEEDNGSDEQTDEDIEEDSCSPSEFMKMMMQFMKSKSSRKRKRAKGEITEGQKVVREGAVLKTHHENVGKYPNIVCRVESFCEAVKHFDSRRRALVTQMGFQGLLEIDMKSIPRQFCYWLMTRVLPDGTMVFGQSEVLPLGPAQVRSVLGLPMGAEKVPFDVGEDDEEKVEKMLI